MRLLITTQILDRTDPILGFFHEWIRALAVECESVEVICLKKGEYSLPTNVRVTSLGKEAGVSRLTYLWRFYRTIWTRRQAYDAVFVHMNPEYVLLGSVLWRFFRKQIGLWYAHGSIDTKLRIAHRLTHMVLTSTERGFSLPSKKRRVVGQGIDTELFAFNPHPFNPILRLLTVGRITRSKNLECILGAFATSSVPQDALLDIVGITMTDEDIRYRAELENHIAERGIGHRVRFLGGKANSELPALFTSADIFISAGRTGSLDKALLEPLATGLLTISSNPAFGDVVRTLGTDGELLTFPEGDIEALGARISALLHLQPDTIRMLQSTLRDSVERDHGLTRLAKKIVASYEASRVRKSG